MAQFLYLKYKQLLIQDFDTELLIQDLKHENLERFNFFK